MRPKAAAMRTGRESFSSAWRTGIDSRITLPASPIDPSAKMGVLRAGAGIIES
jgi:hypothetical protein